MQHGFGSGSAWGIDSGANPTPGKLAILQDVGFDFAYSNKPLHGSYQLPVTVARGTGKISGKAKYGCVSGRAMNALFFGQTKSSGQVSVAEDEAGTVPGSSTYTVTVSNSATFVEDLGVRYSLTGLPFVRVASGPTVGQYSVSAGVYTFAVADASVAVKIDYEYTISGTGEKIAIANTLMGVAPTFKNVFTQAYNSKRQTIVLNACVAGKLGVASKLEDFMMPEMDWDAMADSGNNIGTWSLGEAS
jgi:hypothetical protein